MTCPHCNEDRLVERIGHQWFCQVCSKTWRAIDEQKPPPRPLLIIPSTVA